MEPMADAAVQTITIAAPPELCFAVAVDFPTYPEWAPDVKQAVVVQADELGRATEVSFTAAALGRSARYVLHYDYATAPAELSWKLVSGDITRAIDGSYRFLPSVSEPGGTDVIYELSIELVVPLPGFVKRRAEVRILNTVKELKTRVEALASA